VKVAFDEIAIKQYFAWQKEDKKTLGRINELIKDIQRNGFMDGIGKPEALKHRKGYSRRIDKANRLVYREDGNDGFVILSCKGHYDD